MQHFRDDNSLKGGMRRLQKMKECSASPKQILMKAVTILVA